MIQASNYSYCPWLSNGLIRIKFRRGEVGQIIWSFLIGDARFDPLPLVRISFSLDRWLATDNTNNLMLRSSKSNKGKWFKSHFPFHGNCVIDWYFSAD